VNPVICEAVCQVCTQVIGNDTAVAFGGRASVGIMLPIQTWVIVPALTAASNGCISRTAVLI
jgi:fumarate hydratase class II